MDTLEILLTEISVPRDRLRALLPDNVASIAESMGAQGQIQPIVVRQQPGGGYLLVAGWHRLEAGKKLDWQTIRCEVMEDIDADQVEMVEIDENLFRAELTPAESAMHLTRRKALYLRLHPETGKGKAPANRGGKGGKLKSQSEALSFTKDTAAKTGKGRSTIAREVARGEKVDAQVLTDIRGTSLDQGNELDLLAKLPEEEQRALAGRAKAGEKVSAVKAAADRAEQAAAARSRKPSRAEKEFADQQAKAANAKATTEVSKQVADLVEGFGKIDLSPIAQMTAVECVELMGQLARANARLNEIAMKIAVASGAELSEFDDPSLRYEALSFMRNAIARIEAELTGREVTDLEAAT